MTVTSGKRMSWKAYAGAAVSFNLVLTLLMYLLAAC
jgi:K+-transporting ATPase A subunit